MRLPGPPPLLKNGLSQQHVVMRNFLNRSDHLTRFHILFRRGLRMLDTDRARA
jgi:hypothetical protein